MLKKTITYKDFDGNERTEVHYFNLNRSEAMEIALSLPYATTEIDISEDKNDAQITSRIIEKLGNEGLYKFIKNLILKSYGIKSPDGRKFEKSEQISTDFLQTLAFDEMFTELISNHEEASNFINKVIPTDGINDFINRN